MSLYPFVLSLLLAGWASRVGAEPSPAQDAPPVPPSTEASIAEHAPAPSPSELPTASPRPATTPAAPTADVAPTPFAPATSADPFAPVPTPVVPAAAGGLAPTLPAEASAPAPDNLPPIAASVQPTVAATDDRAHAVEPAKRLHLAGLLGIGSTFDHTVGGVNPLGFGFGLRGDYRLVDEFTFGARVVYFVGGSSSLPTGTISMASWLLAAEAGYVIDFVPVLLTPGIALGVLSRELDGRPAFTSAAGQTFVPGSQTDDRVGMYIAPGVHLVVPLAMIDKSLDIVFVGADLRLDLVLADEVSSNLQLLAQVGLRL